MNPTLPVARGDIQTWNALQSQNASQVSIHRQTVTLFREGVAQQVFPAVPVGIDWQEFLIESTIRGREGRSLGEASILAEDELSLSENTDRSVCCHRA